MDEIYEVIYFFNLIYFSISISISIYPFTLYLCALFSYLLFRIPFLVSFFFLILIALIIRILIVNIIRVLGAVLVVVLGLIAFWQGLILFLSLGRCILGLILIGIVNFAFSAISISSTCTITQVILLPYFQDISQIAHPPLSSLFHLSLSCLKAPSSPFFAHFTILLVSYQIILSILLGGPNLMAELMVLVVQLVSFGFGFVLNVTGAMLYETCLPIFGLVVVVVVEFEAVQI